jgi:ferritin-like metal-binding protein YciE
MTRIVNSMTAFQLNIKTLYGIENSLEHVLPHMIDASVDNNLKNDFHVILKETKIHNDRLEKVFDIIDMKPVKHESEGIKGVIKDIHNIIEDEPAGPIKDVMLAGAIRSLEYFEIANYLNAIEEAKNLGLDKAVKLLEKTLKEERSSVKEFASIIHDDLKLVADEEVND